jgi:hypothetical protein
MFINVAQLDGILLSPPKAQPESQTDRHGRSDPRNASKSDPGLRVQKREDGHENGADKPGNKSQSSLIMQRHLHFQSLPKMLVGALLVAGF